jgi:hypothetical protein
MNEVEVMFEVGQRVVVNPTHYDYTPAWEGTVLRYHRNGDWVVQEDRHHTHAAFHYSRLMAVAS